MARSHKRLNKKPNFSNSKKWQERTKKNFEILKRHE